LRVRSQIEHSSGDNYKGGQQNSGTKQLRDNQLDALIKPLLQQCH